MKQEFNNLRKILNQKDKKKYHFHFVGVGGVSMCSLAHYLKNIGQEVSGSDIGKSKNIQELKKQGIKVFNSHKEQNIAGANYVIYSYAVENNVEVQEAKRLNIPTLSRAKLLGEILKLYKTSICVAGAHGKSTTSALIYHILNCDGKNPSLHLGASLVQNGKSHIDASKEYIVCEACEYKDAFLNFKPSIGVVLNIAPEHLDYFKTFSMVKKSFNKFSKQAKMLICSSKHQIKHKNIIQFNENGFVAKNIKILPFGHQQFDVYYNDEFYDTFKIPLVGEHNIKNSLASIAVAHSLNISKETIKYALCTFKGIKRRFEILSKSPYIIHDYAHHPDEIEAFIKSIRTFYSEKLLIVFQPHTYSRTKLLMESFKNCFEGESDIAIYKTFPAREKYQKQGSAKVLASTLGKDVKYLSGFEKLFLLVQEKVQKNCAIAFLGAGDIDKIANKVCNKLKRNKNAEIKES